MVASHTVGLLHFSIEGDVVSFCELADFGFGTSIGKDRQKPSQAVTAATTFRNRQLVNKLEHEAVLMPFQSVELSVLGIEKTCTRLSTVFRYLQ